MNLVEDAKKAIDKVFEDNSVGRGETLRRLEEIWEHLEPYIEDLESSIPS